MLDTFLVVRGQKSKYNYKNVEIIDKVCFFHEYYATAL